jgi:hypothetical protein
MLEGFTEERDKLHVQGYAESEINTYRIVTAGTDANAVKQSTTPATEFPLGISEDAGLNGKTSYEEDDPVDICYSGVKYLKMSGAGSRHQRIMATTGGMGVAHTSQDNVWIAAVAMKDWVDGEEIAVLIQRQFIGEAMAS